MLKQLFCSKRRTILWGCSYCLYPPKATSLYPMHSLWRHFDTQSSVLISESTEGRVTALVELVIMQKLKSFLILQVWMACLKKQIRDLACHCAKGLGCFEAFTHTAQEDCPETPYCHQKSQFCIAECSLVCISQSAYIRYLQQNMED